MDFGTLFQKLIAIFRKNLRKSGVNKITPREIQTLITITLCAIFKKWQWLRSTQASDHPILRIVRYFQPYQLELSEKYSC